ncbi:hypothetical protein DFH27DRAFT_592918 [Peziza echinospora]|nr:hypothetical protein DFH27DRAFT_592918 [Peziza echinospora]
MENSVPEEPTSLPVAHIEVPASAENNDQAILEVDQLVEQMSKLKATPVLGIDFTQMGKRRRRASTHLVSVGGKKHSLLSDSSATNLITGECCGGGCCKLVAEEFNSGTSTPGTPGSPFPVEPIALPTNPAFASLRLTLSPLRPRNKLSGVPALPAQTKHLHAASTPHQSTCETHPPTFVTPHPPYSIFPARIHDTRALTKDGASKPTYHFDLDVTDYPDEIEGVDFRVGGAIGVLAPNYGRDVDEIFDKLQVPEADRDAPVTLETDGGRWPTIWGEDKPRSLTTTRRELLTWTVDIQSNAPKKQVLRVLAEYAHEENEKAILMYLCSRQGQAAFCELRTGPHVSLLQLLYAFPSCRPPFESLISVLPDLMPRFYSLSSDPHLSSLQNSKSTTKRRTIEVAVTLHDDDESWRGKGARRQGVGSGFLQRQAQKWLAADPSERDKIRIPMFRGLMANPLAKEFHADGPMLLIGAGVGIAPFRGFVQRRLQNANCANKVWVLQGIRDSLLDELYSGEWGVHEDKIRKVVESRVGTGRYVQEEVIAQADLVWFIINNVEGKVFVCGSSKGMGAGVENALIEVAMKKGRLSKEAAKDFWKKKKEGFQYITETW